MRHPLAAATAVIWLLLTAGVATGADAVVISKAVPPDQLTASHLRNVLLGRVTAWSDGRPIIIVLSRSAGSQRLLETFLGRDLDHLLRGWKRLVFTGNGSLPEVTDDDRLAIRRVASTPGAVAFITDASAADLPAGMQSAAIDVEQVLSRPASVLPKPPVP
jgi:hypothetical protein